MDRRYEFFIWSGSTKRINFLKAFVDFYWEVKLNSTVKYALFALRSQGYLPLLLKKKTLPDIVVSAELLICFVSCSSLPSYLEQR
jgi:hypothetical protein